MLQTPVPLIPVLAKRLTLAPLILVLQTPVLPILAPLIPVLQTPALVASF